MEQKREGLTFVSCLEGNLRWTIWSWNKRSWNTDTESDITNIMRVNELGLIPLHQVHPIPSPKHHVSHILTRSFIHLFFPLQDGRKTSAFFLSRGVLSSSSVWCHHGWPPALAPASHHLLQQSFCLYAQRYKGSVFRKTQMERMEGMRGGRRSRETETGSSASLCWTKQDCI